MSRRESGAIASRWIRKHLSTMDHNFYSLIPEVFYLNTQIVSHLNRHFSEKDMKYFKTCFTVLSGSSNKVPSYAAEEIQRSVKVMHDIVHGRYIVSEDGLETVREKHVRGVYGKCPRLHCEENSLLPLGMDDVPSISHTQCFCAKCRDVYRTPLHISIDSVAFGSSLPHLFLEQYPDLCPTKPDLVYVPKIFGFKIHPSSPVLRAYENIPESDTVDRENKITDDGRVS